MNRKTIPLGNGWRLELDRAQVFPDDPGQGTPAMVYGPRGESATFQCALCEGEADAGAGYVAIPGAVMRALEAAEGDMDEFLYP